MPILPVLRWCAGLLACVAALCEAESPAPYSIGPPPAWVTLTPLPAPPADPGGALTVLLDDSQVNLLPEHTVYSRRVLRPGSAAGVDKASEIRINFNPDYQHLVLHAIRRLRNGDSRDLLADAHVRLLRREQQLEAGIHDNVLTADIILDDVRSGDLIDYSYTITGFNPVFGSRQFGWIPLDGFHPVVLLTARVITDEHHPLTVRTVHSEARIEQQHHDHRLEYRVVRHDIAPIPDEDNLPAWYTPYGLFEYSQYGSWAEVQDWAAQMYAGIPPDGDAVKAEAARLRAASRDDADFASRTLSFVQDDIRYEGLELGTNSHLPHGPDEVLRLRYGDCKDKSLLLQRLLAEGGIPARSALVSAGNRRGIADDVPSPLSFDHVIVKLELGGKSYWVDSTAQYQEGPLAAREQDDYGLALVIGGKNGLEPMYAEPPMSFYADIVSHYRASDFSGPIQLEITSTFSGNPAEWQRYRFKAEPLAEIDKSLTGSMSYYYPDIRSLQAPQVIDDPAQDRFVVIERYEIPHYWDVGKSGLQQKIVLPAFPDVLSYPHQVQRQSPFALPSPRLITCTTYFHYPMDVRLFNNTRDQVDEFAFQGLSFHGRDHYQDSTYIHRGALRVTGDHVDAADMVDYARFVKSVDQESEFTLTLPDAGALGFPDVQALRRRLQNQAGQAK